MGVFPGSVVYTCRAIVISTDMHIFYVKPEIAELDAMYLLALAASPAEADSSLEEFDNNFTDLTW